MEAITVYVSRAFLFEVFGLQFHRVTVSENVCEENDVSIVYLGAYIVLVIVESHVTVKIEEAESLEKLSHCPHMVLI